jgi:hypothetical protein
VQFIDHGGSLHSISCRSFFSSHVERRSTGTRRALCPPCLPNAEEVVECRNLDRHRGTFYLISTIVQLQHQYQQTHIRPYTQRGQQQHHIPRSPELLPPHHSNRTSIVPSHTLRLGEELPIPLLPSIRAHGQHPRTVDGEERTDAVEFTREDLEHDERKGELGERGADVGSFEGALCGADLDELVVGEDYGAGAVEA